MVFDVTVAKVGKEKYERDGLCYYIFNVCNKSKIKVVKKIT